jgi:hypothetical protein
MASLTWFGLPGLSGRLVDVHADGRTAVYAPAQTRNIADFAWFNGELLAADDVLPGILRFNAQRRQLEDFGGPALYAQLRQKLHQFRHTALFGSHWIWVAAMALTLCGLASGIRSMDETSREQLGQLKNVFTLQFPPLPGVTPVTLGTPAPKPRPLGIRMALGIFVEGVLRLGFVVVVIAPEYFMQWAPAGTSSRTMACIAIGLFCSMELFTYLAQTRSKRRFRQRNLLNPEKESELNREGVELARRNANNWLALMQKDGDGERPLESTTLQQGIFSRWLLLTDRRIILYRWRAHITRHTIWQRAEVADASGTDQGVLCIQFHNGERLRGTCPSAVTAARIVKKLGCASSP